MPRLTKSLPKYRYHRASGQAVLTLDIAVYYLGPHSTKASRLEYDRLRNGSPMVDECRSPMPITDADSKVTVMEVLAAYKRFADGYYVKNSKPTNEVKQLPYAMKAVKR